MEGGNVSRARKKAIRKSTQVGAKKVSAVRRQSALGPVSPKPEATPNDKEIAALASDLDKLIGASRQQVAENRTRVTRGPSEADTRSISSSGHDAHRWSADCPRRDGASR